MSQEAATPTTRMFFGRVAVLLFFLLGLVTGCGDTPEGRRVADAVIGFVQAIADDDGERACLLLSGKARAELIRTEGGRSCERAAERLPVRDATDSYDLGDVRFGPDERSARIATSMVRDDLARETGIDPDIVEDALGLPALPGPIRLEEGDGDWRITNLDWYFE